MTNNYDFDAVMDGQFEYEEDESTQRGYPKIWWFNGVKAAGTAGHFYTSENWQCTYEKKIDETTSMIAHEGLVIASNVVDATNIYRSRLPEWVRGSFPTKEESLDCKHCNAPVGECDGNCDALPNELDDTSENMG